MPAGQCPPNPIAVVCTCWVSVAARVVELRVEHEVRLRVDQEPRGAVQLCHVAARARRAAEPQEQRVAAGDVRAADDRRERSSAVCLR